MSAGTIEIQQWLTHELLSLKSIYEENALIAELKKKKNNFSIQRISTKEGEWDDERMPDILEKVAQKTFHSSILVPDFLYWC